MSTLYHAQQLPLFNLYKFCPACNRDDKLLTDFSSDSSRADGLYPICKDCINKRRRELRHNPEISKRPKILRSTRKGYKICPACGQEKHIEQCVEGRNLCKDCRNDYDRERGRTPRRREQRLRYKATHRDQSRASNARSYLKYRAQRCEKFARRYAKRFNIPLEKIDYEAILTRDGYICHVCTGIVAPDDLHFDHVIPLARGGTHSEDNVKVAHKLCNLRKGKRLMEELPLTLWRNIA